MTDLPDLRPFEAGLHHLKIVVEAARESGVHHLVNPDPNGISYRLVIRESEAADFWDEMVEVSDSERIYATWTQPQEDETFTRPLSNCAGEELRSADSVLIHRRLRTRRRGITPRFEAGCTVETWHPKQISDSVRAWSAPTINHRSSLVRWEPDDEVSLEVPWGKTPTLQPFLKDSFLRRDFPIDAVYFWVDGADPKWRRRRDQALGQTEGSLLEDSTVEERFRQHDELRYSLRSLEYFAPWIRRVFLLTDRQRPHWLVEDSDQITVVDHSEIWADRSALPIFNSRALAARAHRIPGLAENFLLLNDDFFFGAPVHPNRWFTPSGQPIAHNSSSTLPDRALLEALPTQIHARYNALALVSERSPHQPTRLFKHAPTAQSKSWCAELERRFPEHYENLMRSRFRQTTDIEPIWLHHYLGYAEGRTVLGALNYAYINLADTDVPSRLEQMADSRTHEVFCLNDQAGALPENLDAMDPFLKGYFPVPSRFENPGS